MTPNDKSIVKALIAVAWADGQMEESEATVIDGMLAGFDASEEDERELREYARVRRTLDDIVVTDLSTDDRELLLGNAALLTHADGEVSDAEREIIAKLTAILEFEDQHAYDIVESVRGGALDRQRGG